MRQRLADLSCGLVATCLAAYSALVGHMLRGLWSTPPDHLNRLLLLALLVIYSALVLLVFSPLLITLGLAAGCAWPIVRRAKSRVAQAARGGDPGGIVACAGAAAIVALSPKERAVAPPEGPPVSVRRMRTWRDSLVMFATLAAGLSPVAAISFSACAWRVSPGVQGKRIAKLDPFGPDG